MLSPEFRGIFLFSLNPVKAGSSSTQAAQERGRVRKRDQGKAEDPVDKERGITVEDSKVLVNEALIGELRAHGGHKVYVPVNEDEVLNLRGNGSLLRANLTPHANHHISHHLETEMRMIPSPAWEDGSDDVRTLAQTPLPWIFGITPKMVCIFMSDRAT